VAAFPHDRIVIVTRPTGLEDLIQRFQTRDQARFYIEHMGGSFADYEAEHAAFESARAAVREALPRGPRVQWLDRAFLPTFTFPPGALVAVLGRDGLVVNAAKYLDGQPVLAMNPDPSRIDGALLPFAGHRADLAAAAFAAVAAGAVRSRAVTMARAALNDGQAIEAVNDLFVGRRTHASARYRLRYDGREEDQSSSGLIVSTGAGSTGWLRSVHAGAAAIVAATSRGAKVGATRDGYAFDWESGHLVFSAREPFVTKVTGADLAYGRIDAARPLEIVSQMPQEGVIFGDGVEEDFLPFGSGAVATIAPSARKLHLLVPAPAGGR